MTTTWTEPSAGTDTFNDPSTSSGKGYGKTPYGSPRVVTVSGYGDPTTSTSWTEAS